MSLILLWQFNLSTAPFKNKHLTWNRRDIRFWTIEEIQTRGFFFVCFFLNDSSFYFMFACNLIIFFLPPPPFFVNHFKLLPKYDILFCRTDSETGGRGRGETKQWFNRAKGHENCPPCPDPERWDRDSWTLVIKIIFIMLLERIPFSLFLSI